MGSWKKLFSSKNKPQLKFSAGVFTPVCNNSRQNLSFLKRSFYPTAPEGGLLLITPCTLSYKMYRRTPKSRAPWLTSLHQSVRRLVGAGRDFCLFTSMHGFSHIAGARRHWAERLLWVAVTACAIWGALDISLGQLQRYNENPTVVALEKDFRTWHFNYPALTVCYVNRVNPSKLPEVIKETWDVDASDEKFDYYKRFVTTIANSDLFHLEQFEEFKGDDSLNVDLFKLAVDVMPELSMKPTWSEGVNPTWFPVMTESGACYTTNSIAIADVVISKLDLNETKAFPLSCFYASLSCYIILEVSTSANFYFHSPYDVVDITAAASHIFTTLNRVTELSVQDTGCGRGVKQLSPGRRGCLYTDEPGQEGRRVYSTNTCRLSCRSRLAVKLCGCRPFYYFYEAEGPVCTPAGMACLAQHPQQLASNGGQRCACAQQCLDSVYKEVSTDDQIWEKGPFLYRGALRYTVQAPRTRYTREIVFHFQDLVVSFGGAAGLFLGASFISFVEVFYFILARVLKGLIAEDKPKQAETDVVMKKPAYSYEATRIKVLNSILDEQARYDKQPSHYTYH